MEISTNKIDGGFCVCAYGWNKDDEWCSELGDIAIATFGGGIKGLVDA